MNITSLELLSALTTGALMGWVYFAGLWWTLRRLAGSARPALLITSSLVLRIAVVSFALVWMADGAWQFLLGALLGFIAVREIMVRRFRLRNDEH